MSVQSVTLSLADQPTAIGRKNEHGTNHRVGRIGPTINRNHFIFNGIPGRQISGLPSWPIRWDGNRKI
jgi:hypothetical protein